MDIGHEHEDGETLESKFVRDIDKIELILQMVEYERVSNLDLGDFSWVASRIVLPEVKEWAGEVLREREEFWGGRPHAAYWAEELLQITCIPDPTTHLLHANIPKAHHKIRFPTKICPSRQWHTSLPSSHSLDFLCIPNFC
jgi:hypothetical protein